jgi:hypothetical protein
MEVFAYIAIIFMSGYATTVVMDPHKENKEALIVPVAVGLVILALVTGGYGILAAAGTIAVVYGFERA